MTWIMALTLSAVVIIILIVLLARPMKIPREPDREGVEDEDAVRAYNRVSRWPIFTLERSIVMHALTKHQPRGWLLDVGCGPGYLVARISRSFPDLSVIGLDISDQMATIAKNNWLSSSRGNKGFLVGDAQRLPFSDNTIDYVVSSLSLHHWKDAPAALREIYRVLKPGGRFLVFDLRRDGRRFFYYLLVLGQLILGPKAIRRTNGAVGSFWASYTAPELETMLSEIPFRQWQVQRRFGWMLASGSGGSK